MRTYGRDENGQWYEVTIDANGFDDDIQLTTLAQCLASLTNESPFYPLHGIPAIDSVVNKTHPDYFVERIRGFFAPLFTSLTIIKQVDSVTNRPTYNVNVIKNSGAAASLTIRT